MRTRRGMLRFALVLLPALGLAGCGGDAAQEAEPLEAGAGTAIAEQALGPATFDSISWPSRAEALDRGAVVYSYSCAKCHGDTGAGDAGYVMQGRVLRPPSFKQEDWRFGQDLDGLRSYIHAGNDRGMPHWGDAGLPARDIDAVARYVQRRLWGRL